MTRPHWSNCDHKRLDRDGYCEACGDLRRVVKVHPSPKKRCVPPFAIAEKAK